MDTSMRFLAFFLLAAALGPAQRAHGQAPAAPPQAQPAVLSSTDGELPGVRVEVTELKRSASVVTLKFTLINESSEEFDFSYDLADPSMSAADYNSIGGVHLIDSEGRKKYEVIRDANRKCVCSGGLKALQPQSRITLWARFPAPPPEVGSVSVMIPHFIPMDNVPLGQ